ncbi:MAG: polyprenyl synthetase family protein [Bacteroidales bacterium]|nr:polyprenyl synthetase family protein [Bacteroidales bacterium]
MLTLSECQEIINQAFREIQLPELPANLYDPVRYVLGHGGKRIRPALVLMACNVFSERIDDAIYPAMALEVFHNFTLVHDDIMDDSLLRRSQPTVHAKWNRNTGILSGDAMVIKSYELLSHMPQAFMPQLFALFCKTAMEVCEGQQYDMDFEKKKEVSAKEYLKMIELKTSVLIAASLKTGAIIGGAEANDADLLYEFGRNLGIAFQIQDDYLDLYADPSKFGKNIGNDIVSNKKTILLVHAMQTAKGEDKKNLIHWLEKKEFDRVEKINVIKAIYNKLGIQGQIIRHIRHYYETGLSFLNQISADASRKEELLKATGFLLTRSE